MSINETMLLAALADCIAAGDDPDARACALRNAEAVIAGIEDGPPPELPAEGKRFTVFVHQYVEEIAELEIVAKDEHEARDIGMRMLRNGDIVEGWEGGDDAILQEVFQINDENGQAIWDL